MRSQKAKGPWIHRATIRLLTVVFGVLIYWVLGFIVNDIGSIAGPLYSDIEKEYIDASMVAELDTLEEEQSTLRAQIARKQSEMSLVKDNSENLQKTVNQLAELHKASAEKAQVLSASDRKSLNDSLAAFINSQSEYQRLNGELAALLAEQDRVATHITSAEDTLRRQKAPAQIEYQRQQEAHDLRLAAWKLLILVPLLILAIVLIVLKRSSLYFPFFLSSAAATLIKVALVIHEYFPTRYFKYILIVFFLAAIGAALVHFIRQVAAPKVQWLIRQYREAYDRFLCPICEFPIKQGPRRFLFWTRRSVIRTALPTSNERIEACVCPACGTRLYEECPDCHNVRHSILPFCEHCGAEKPLDQE